jgi:glycosyltransferase involved in cell wall biosynthesis
VPRRRILHVIETLGHGGAEHQLAVITERLDRDRFESVVCHLHEPSHLADRIRARGVPVYGLGLPRTRRAWPTAVGPIARLIREVRPDLVHTSLFEADMVGGAAARLMGVPAINTLCNVGGEKEKLLDNSHMSWPKLWAHSRLWGAAMRTLHRHSIAISRAVMRSAEETYGRDPARMSLVYRAYLEQPEDSSPGTLDALRAELAVGDAEPLLLNVGRLAPQKGQRYLIRALPEIVRAHPRALLLVVGEGWLRPELEAEVRAVGMEGHVRFLGRRQDTRRLMLLADQFVFPSLFEGLGVALVEAAGLGRPTIASDVGPIPEVIEHERSGLLVPPQDPAALARAIIRLAGDPVRAQALGAAARARIAEEFSIERMIAALESVYERALEGHG